MLLQLSEILRLFSILIIFIFFGFLLFEFKSFKFKFLNIPIYLSIAIPLLSAGFFFLKFTNIPTGIISLLIVLVCVMTFFKIGFEPLKLRKEFIFFVLFTIISMVTISGTSIFEGFTNNKSIIISGPKTHDALWHIALEESISKSIPPVNPIYAPEKIKNYHYLTDVFISFVSQLTHISTVNLFLRWIPLVLGFLFISTTYILLMQITGSRTVSYLGSSLIIFSSSLSYLAPFFFKNANATQSVFWLDQSTRYLVNPHLTLSLIVINIILLLTLKSIKKYWILVAMLLGISAVIKVYGFIILLGSFLFVGIFYLIREKNWKFLQIFGLSLVTATLIVFLSGVNSGFPFIFHPGWFIGTMYQSSDRLNTPDWEIHRQLFLQSSNYRRLIIQWVAGVLIFFTGNFGLKILGVPLIFPVLKKVNKLKPIILLSIVSLFSSLVLPMIFIQKGTVWNTIQFMHYAQLPLVILITFYVQKFKQKYQIIILLSILLIGLPMTIIEVKQNFQLKYYAVLDKELVEGLDIIGKIIPGEARILVGSNISSTSIVPALAKKDVFFTDPGIIDILGIDASKRIDYVDKVEKGTENCKPNETFVFNNPYTASISGQIIFKNKEIVAIQCSNHKLLLSH